MSRGLGDVYKRQFNGSTLGGKQLVTFEELYDMTNLEEPKKVTVAM